MANPGADVTAGLRGAYWDPERVEPDVALSVHPLRCGDGQVTAGYLYGRGDERVVAVLGHPREHLVAYYLASELARQGIAAFIVAPRSVGNDIKLEHETALLDVAAGMAFVRGLGFETVLTVGNSGGGPLHAFYNQQALLAPERRIERTPGGRATGLAAVDMPPADGIVFVSAHLGQGRLLMNGIDPSVTDEADALSADLSLNPFSPGNGFRGTGASYTSDFIERYRAAQVERVRRIDAVAREHIEVRMAARARVKAGAGGANRMVAAHTPIFPVWRTDADLRCWDLSLDPSDRRLGSLWGANPAVSNLGSIGFARLCTAESWLSTWSGLSSNASMESCAPAIEQPTLLVEYTGDNSTFPSDNDQLFGWIGTSAKSRQKFAGDHHGRPVNAGDPNPRPLVGAAIGQWVAEQFGGTRSASTTTRETVHAS